jgi:hypothetical protein
VLGERVVLDSPPGGNANGRFDPGETGGLCAALRNIGTEGLTGVCATLVSGDARFQVTDPDASYGAIPAGGQAINTGDPFGIEVDPGIPIETAVPCTLFVSGSADYADTCALTVVVGEIRAIDPIPDGPRRPSLYWAYDDCDSGYSHRPDFEWVEIAGVGTRLTLSDDQTVVVPLPSGFSWRFYGQEYSQVSVCGNGFVAPGSQTYSSYTNYSLPYASAPGMVALNWDDLYPPNGGGVWHLHDAANHRFIVEWDSVHYYSSALADKFQMVLYDTTVATPSGDNEFTVQYLTANNYVGNTVGIQDQAASIAIEALFNGSYHRGSSVLAPGRAVRYTTFEPTTGVTEQPGAPGLDGRAYCLPNPFRGGTFVHYTARAAGTVEVRAFDAAGREVDRLQFTTGPGAGSVSWRPANLSRGTYFLRVSTSGDESVAKVLVLD